jgi:hypothetical protein
MEKTVERIEKDLKGRVEEAVDKVNAIPTEVKSQLKRSH